jgi:O-antigen/teichoic acid export membrane protein
VKKPGRNIGTLIDLIVLSGGELASILLGIVAFAHLARALGPESYGAVELAISMGFVFAVAVDLGTGAIGTREIARDRSRMRDLAAQIPATRLLLAAIAIPAMGLSATLMGQPPETVRLVWLFSFAMLALPWQHRWLLQGLELTNWVSPARAIRMSIFFVGTFALIHSAQDLQRVGMIEIAAAAGLAAYYLIVQQRRVTPVRLSFSGTAMRSLAREGLPLGMTQFVWSATQYLPTLLVATFIGGVAIAWFGAAHRIVMSLWTFSWLYHFNLNPILIRSLAVSPEAFQSVVRPSLKVTGWAGVGVSMLVSMLGTPLCRLVFGEAFVDAGPTLSVLIWILPATLLSGHARSALIASGSQHDVLYAQVTGGVVMLSLGAVLVPTQGALGAAVAMVISSFAVWGFAHFQATRKVGPMPGISAIARPAFATMTAIGAVLAVNTNAWLSAGLAVVIFCALALIFDRKVIADLRWVAGIKSHVAPEQT